MLSHTMCSTDSHPALSSASSRCARPRPADRRYISDTVREVRLALLDADVALSVVKTLLMPVKRVDRASSHQEPTRARPSSGRDEERTRLMGDRAPASICAQRPVGGHSRGPAWSPAKTTSRLQAGALADPRKQNKKC